MTTYLAVHVPVERLVAIYQDAEAKIRQGFATVDGALRSLGSAFEDDGKPAGLRGRYGRRNDCEWEDPEPTIKELRREIWADLIERIQVRRVMSVAAWEEFRKEMEHGDPPAITVDTVRGMVAHFRTEAPNMLEAAIKEVFEWLRPRGWAAEYKTNTELEIGERVILPGAVERWSTNWHVNHYRQQHMMALENVFRLLDGGKMQNATGKNRSDLEASISACTEPSGPCGQTDYFAFKGYRNQNLHLRFRRMDLVARLNAVAGGMRINPVVGGLP